MAVYYISFSYPDGHVEEIEETFNSLKGAVDYGFNLLNQVQVTELYKRGSGTTGEAYFSVREVEDGNRKVVYNSLGK